MAAPQNALDTIPMFEAPEVAAQIAPPRPLQLLRQRAELAGWQCWTVAGQGEQAGKPVASISLRMRSRIGERAVAIWITDETGKVRFFLGGLNGRLGIGIRELTKLIEQSFEQRVVKGVQQ